MIPQNRGNENTQIALKVRFIPAIREMKISRPLHESNIRKDTRAKHQMTANEN